jgi:diguanylate cyclase (GGDEF)-like protein
MEITRELHLVVFVLAALDASLDAVLWAPAQGNLYGFAAISDGIFAAWLGFLALLLWRNKQPQTQIFVAGYLGAAVYIFANLFVALDSHYRNGTGSTLAVISPWVGWILVICVASFVTFRSSEGLKLSLGILLASLAIGVYFLVPLALSGKALDNLDGFLQLFLSTAVIIVLSNPLTRYRERFSQTDFLTGIPNRRHAYASLASELQRSRRYGSPFSLILFDLDHFKRVNDTKGHPVGDAVLQEVSSLINRRLRQTDQLSRWGGEEFMIQTPNSALVQSRELAEELSRTLASHSMDKVGVVTASFGVGQYHPGDTPESLIERADAALYRAKANGRSRVETES